MFWFYKWVVISCDLVRLPPNLSKDQVEVSFAAVHAVSDGCLLLVARCWVLAGLASMQRMDVGAMGPAVVVVLELAFGSRGLRRTRGVLVCGSLEAIYAASEVGDIGGQV